MFQHKPNLKYNTQMGYLNIMEGQLKPRFGKYRLKALTAASLQEFANDMKMTGLAKSHISKILSVSRAALDYAVEPLHYLAANPMQYVK